MRVLIASDGSAGAAEAVALAQTMAWPADSTLRIVSVVESGPWIAPLPRMPASPTPALEDELVAYLEAQQAEIVERFGPGRGVEAAILRGRPASAILDDAREFAADVVIVGYRGLGPIASLVLGSVSSEVVDHAPCPVLVARRATLTNVVFATDGSPSARAAEDVLVRWPIFDGLAIRVVSVADALRPWTSGVAPLMQRQALDAYAQDIEEATAESARIAEGTAARLRAAGREAEADVRRGDAAAEIIAMAAERRADLVVLGSRGRSGLARIVLGSVARNVLAGTETSVLIVREAAGKDPHNGSAAVR
ncbi:MAG: universal stress protein [Candidatus Limnocylindria bacterium]